MMENALVVDLIKDMEKTLDQIHRKRIRTRELMRDEIKGIQTMC